MEITQSIQINFNFPKVYRIDNDDLEFGSILYPGRFNITVNTNSFTVFTCTLAQGQQIKNITYGDEEISYTVSGDMVSFTIETSETGIDKTISVEAESKVDGCEIFDLNQLTLSKGNNNIFVRFRNLNFADSNISNVISYEYIADLKGTVWKLKNGILPGPFGLYHVNFITEDEEEYEYLRFGKVPTSESYTPKRSDVLYYYKETDDNTDTDINHNTCVYYPGRNPHWDNEAHRQIFFTGGDTTNRWLISWLQLNADKQHDYLYNDRSTSSRNLTSYICDQLSIQPNQINKIILQNHIPDYYSVSFSVGASDIQGRILNEWSRLKAYCQNTSSGYEIYITDGTNTIFAPRSMKYMFYNCGAATIYLDILNTSSSTSFESSFEGCENLIHFSQSFSTSNVTTFKKMFYGCSSIENCSLNNFLTNNALNFSYMFYNCVKLQLITLSSANTSSVTDFSYMFYNCKLLSSGVLSALELDSAIDISHMCDGCEGFTSITLGWSTNHVEDMSYLFANCTGLTSFSITNGSFLTANVTSMASMFENCAHIIALNLSNNNFITTNVTDFSRMFYNCLKIKNLDITSFVMNNGVIVQDMLTLGSNLGRGLTSINLPQQIGTTLTISAGNMKWYDTQDNLINNGIINSTYQNSTIVGCYRQIITPYLVPYITQQLHVSAEQILLSFVNSKPNSLSFLHSFSVEVGSYNSSTIVSNGDLKAYCRNNLGGYEVNIYGGVDNVIELPNNCAAMFSGLSRNGSLDCSKLNSSHAHDMASMFTGCTHLTSLDLRNFDTISVSQMEAMFGDCSNLNTLDLRGFNTNNVTDMSSMFRNCFSLRTLRINSNIFKTDNVTNMNSMFNGCQNIPSLDLSFFNTEKVTNMGRMFRGCKTLTSLNLGNFKTNWVTNMSEMFMDCQQLSSLIINSSNFDTTNVTNMEYMFFGCQNIQYLPTDNFNTSNVIAMQYMFMGCHRLTGTSNNHSSLDLSNFNTSNVTNMGHMFSSAIALTNIVLSTFNTASVTDMSGMFTGCSSLISLNLNTFTTPLVTKMNAMFEDCASLTFLNINNFTISNSANVAGMLNLGDNNSRGSVILVHLPSTIGQNLIIYADNKPWFDVNNNQITDGIITSAYEGEVICTVAKRTLTLDVSDVLAGTTSGSGQYWPGESVVVSATAYTGYNFTNWTINGTVVSTSSAFTYTMPMSNVTMVANFEATDGTLSRNWYINNIERSDIKTLRLTNNSQYLAGKTERTGDFGTNITCYASNEGDVVLYCARSIYAPVDCTELFANLSVCTNIYFDNFITDNTINMFGMFSYDYRLTSLDLSNFNTSSVLKMGYMFSFCNSLSSINMSGWDMSQLQSMEYMFQNCLNLSINQFSFNSLYLQTIEGLFQGCSSITSMTLYSNNNIINNMSHLFYGCDGLLTVDISNFNTSEVLNMEAMFFGCIALTSINFGNIDTSKVRNMGSMFYATVSLSSIDLGNFNTSNVIDMSGMFSHCAAQSLNLSNFDTSNVINMSLMFSGAINIPSLDLRSFDTSNVTDMQSMFNGWAGLPGFSGWSVLSSIQFDRQKFNTSKVTNMSHMFAGIHHMTTIDLSFFDTSQVTNMTGMFGFSTWQSLDLSSFDFSHVTSMEQMFYITNSLSTIVWPQNINTSRLTNMRLMFAPSGIISMDFSGWDLTQVTDMMGLFHGCNHLTSVIFPNSTFGTRVTTISGWPNDIYISNTNVGLFDECTQLSTITNLSYMSLSQVSDFTNTFKNCTSLTSIDISGFIIPSNAVVSDMLNLGTNNNRGTITVNLPQLINTNFSVYGDSKTWYDYNNDPISSSIITTALQNTSICTDIRIIDGYFNENWKTNIASVIDPATITSILFTDDISELSGYTKTAVNCGTGIKTYKSGTNIIFYATGDIYLPSYGYGLFRDITTLVSFDVSMNIHNFYTSNTTTMGYMFYRCYSLSSLNISDFNTSNVTNMQSMFEQCRSLTSLNLSNFNTSSVTNFNEMFGYCYDLTSLNISNFNTSSSTFMRGMFIYCQSLISLDLNNFNTVNVIDMSNMFLECSGLLSLNVSSFVTTSVTNMSSMFDDCRGLTSLNVSNFNTSNVENMSFMFEHCDSLMSLDVSHFNTSSVTNMAWMFAHCYSLTSLILSNFDTSNVESMYCMFAYSDNLLSLNLSNFNTSSVVNMGGMFNGCSGLASVNVSSFDTSLVTNMGSMFSGCSGLNNLNITNFNTQNVTNFWFMFYGCSGLTSINVSNFNTNNAVSLLEMFRGCSSLTSIDVSGFNTSNVTSISSMFADCNSITSIDLSHFITSNMREINGLFQRCYNLTTIDLSNFDTSNVTNMEWIFFACNNLISVNLSNWDTSSVTNMDYMFNSCNSLTTIYVTWGMWNTNSVTDSGDMFSGCVQIRGQLGTTYNSSYVDKTYARIDAVGSPGYLSELPSNI